MKPDISSRPAGKSNTKNLNWTFYLGWRDSVLNYKRTLNTANTAYFSGLIQL